MTSFSISDPSIRHSTSFKVMFTARDHTTAPTAGGVRYASTMHLRFTRPRWIPQTLAHWNSYARSCQQVVVRIYCAACDGIVPLSSSSMETERSTLSSQVLGFLSPHSMKGIVNFALALQ